MILVIDNQDSFVETLARYVREAGYETRVVRYDALSTDEAAGLHPSGVILSPGPYTPAETPLSVELPLALPDTPMLGVCLGHLAIAESYGGKTIAAKTPVHGEASAIRYEDDLLFQGLPDPFSAGRYHALVSQIRGTPLIPTAWSEDGELMAFRHESLPHRGVQFHPESVLTPEGRDLLGNFLETTR
ncbi:anthranilate synthase component II [Parvularcula maris]|uniref:Aminodeoxychorismate/anthranilate synthase component II n=1 Tax=Parvularcula maris TaxID=2965077 RepID=A0A9X2L8X7_9PROT|nr:aminodeoxychorismate/anthranilate synthase component II [Parvularcula maris]MCQ8185187.1 aminodeoxychorismate/anthranilate synthase component II [Parvularcula maris]